MAEVEAAAIVERIYAAVGRGDIPAVLRMAAADVEWQVPGPPEIPWYGSRRGKEALAEYFASLARHTGITVVEPRRVVAQGDTVAVVLRVEYTLQHNACPVAQEHAHIWTIRRGKIARYQDFQDTAGVVSAWRGL